MITLTEIIIYTLAAVVVMECAIGTWMVWGIAKQLRERESCQTELRRMRLAPPVYGTLRFADGAEVAVKIMESANARSKRLQDEFDKAWRKKVERETEMDAACYGVDLSTHELTQRKEDV